MSISPKVTGGEKITDDKWTEKEKGVDAWLAVIYSQYYGIGIK